MHDDNTNINHIKEAENLLERERIEAENLLERERINNEHIINNSLIESENLILKTLTESENLILKTLAELENLITDMVGNDIQLKKNTAIKLDSLKKMAEVVIKNLKQSASTILLSLKNAVTSELETLKQLAFMDATELKQVAAIDAMTLKNVQNIENKELWEKAQDKSFDLMDHARLVVEMRKQKAIKTNEKLKRRALEKSRVLLDRARVFAENLKKEASLGADNIRDQTNNYSSDLIKNSYEWNEQITTQETKTQNTQILKLLNKTKLTLIIISVLVVGTSIFYLSTNVPDNSKSLTTGYVIENLRGDTVDTFVSWKKPPDSIFHIHILNSKYATQERIDAILDVITSQQKIDLDDSLVHKGPKGMTSTYYVGWEGALNSITDNTKFNIIKNLHFHVDEDVPTGDIEIELSNLSSPDGYSGYTKSIVDESNHQILKSTITIYDIDRIDTEQLKTILRHELGHGFGLAHSTAPEDLMAPIITTIYPYISECDLDAIHHLYDGGESSQVVCEK